MSRTECERCSRTVGDGVPYCPACADTLYGELLAVPGLVCDLAIAGARLDRLGRDRAGGKSAETPVPIALAADGNPADYERPLQAITAAVGPAAWALEGYAELGLEDALAGAPGLVQLVHNNRAGRSARPDTAAFGLVPVHTIELAAVWLACHIRELRSMPSAARVHDRVTEALAYVRRKIDRLPDLVLKGLCTYTWTRDGELVECRTELKAERGAAWVRCPRCSAHYDVRELEAAALRTADSMLFTLGEIEKLMRELGEPVSRSALYLWAQHRRLRPAGWRRPDGSTSTVWIHRNDPALYRLGEARSLRRVDGEAAR